MKSQTVSHFSARYSERAKRTLFSTLLVLTVLSAIPIYFLVTRAWAQLKMESLLRYKTSAEELGNSIDATVANILAREQRRPFEHYRFLNVNSNSLTGQQGVRFSPLSEKVAEEEVPGTIGYFEIDPTGRISSPLLPRDEANGSRAPAIPNLSTKQLDERKGILKSLRALLEPRQSMWLSNRTDPLTRSQATFHNMLDAERSEGVEGADAIDKYRSEQVSEPLEQGLEPLQRQAEAFSQDFDAAPRMNSAGGVEQYRSFQAQIGPLRAIPIEVNSIVLFRRVLALQSQYIQGAVISRSAFFDRIADETFRKSNMNSRAALEILSNGERVKFYRPEPKGARMEKFHSARDEDFLPLHHARRLPSPLDKYEFRILTLPMPYPTGAYIIATAVVMLGLIVPFGFFGVYSIGVQHIELARKRSDFASAVSHELKTPLTSIRMYSEALKEGWVADDGKRKQYYEMIYQESERLNRLIQNILQLTGLANQSTSIQCAKKDLRPVIMNMMEQLKPLAEGGGFELESRSAAGQMMNFEVEIDEGVLLNIVSNLIENSLKFSKNAEKKVIEIGLESCNNQVAVIVRDFGSGVSDKDFKHLGSLFYRGEDELRRKTKGTGIGLALVVELAAAMRGEVSFRNADPGLEVRVSFRQVPQT